MELGHTISLCSACQNWVETCKRSRNSLEIAHSKGWPESSACRLWSPGPSPEVGPHSRIFLKGLIRIRGRHSCPTDTGDLVACVKPVALPYLSKLPSHWAVLSSLSFLPAEWNLQLRSGRAVVQLVKLSQILFSKPACSSARKAVSTLLPCGESLEMGSLTLKWVFQVMLV